MYIMANKKADNPWYGNGFEQSIEGVFNHKGTLVLEKIPTESAKELAIQAQSYINQYNVLVEPMKTCIWTGKHTRNADGDLIVNGHVDEVKHVSSGKGTYVQTSWSVVERKFGLDYLNPQNYMTQNGCYDMLAQRYGEDKISRTNCSPVNSTMAKDILADKEFYIPYQNHEKESREVLNARVCSDLESNIDLRRKFLMGFVTKDVSDKHMPDYYIVYNYKLDKITFIYTKQQLLEMAQDLTFTPDHLGFIIGYFRFAVSWQNGTGLNNPTIRMYIK